MKFLLIILLGLFSFSGCDIKSPFNFTLDYRQFPIAVDCEKPTDVYLTFQKDGMPTTYVDEKTITFKTITNEKGEPRKICIFDNMTLIDFCKYKGAEQVAPYWVSSYGKINAVKCQEVLR